MDSCPLVSIVVVCYNSSKFIEETLDSVLKQTYPNIEIIISDDCSTDNTIDLCQDWISKNKESGKPIYLVETQKNTGVAGNCNRGLAVSRGKWIKFIAGDDMLAPTAIEDYMGFVEAHPEVRHFIAKAIHFTDQMKESDMRNPDIISTYLYRDEVTAKMQYSVIKKCFFGSGPTYFIQSEALKEVGGFDERFPMQEDYPLFIKMIGKGHKMMYLDAVTVYKRMVPTSLQYDKNKGDVFPKNQVRMVMDYKYRYREEVLKGLWKAFHYYSLWLQRSVIKAGNSIGSLKCKILLLIYKLTDPFVWYSRYIHRKSENFLKSQYRGVFNA